MKYITREEWGALPPVEEPTPITLPVRSVILTYIKKTPDPDSDAPEDNNLDYLKMVQDLQRRQIEDKHLSDLKYNFVVDPNGTVYEGRGWYGAVPPPKHRPEWTDNNIVIAQINWRLADGPKRPIVKSTKELVELGILNGYIKEPFQFLDTRPWRCPKVVSKLGDVTTSTV